MSATEPQSDLRPSRETPNLQLPVPGDAGPADYVSATGALADRLDAVVVHPGDIKMTAAESAPEGWLLCDGQAVSRTDYARLFQAIGERFGAGDGAATFNLPNLQGRFAVGASGGRALGAMGGEEVHWLSEVEMPSHYHPGFDGGPTLVGAASGAPAGITVGGTGYTLNATGWRGGDQAHNNMPPFVALHYLIKT